MQSMTAVFRPSNRNGCPKRRLPREEAVAGEEAGLPTLIPQAQQWAPVGSLGRRLWLRAWRADVLNAEQLVGRHPEAGVNGRPLILDPTALQGFTAGAAPEGEELHVVARRVEVGVVDHAGHVGGVVPRLVEVQVAVVGESGRRRADGGARDRTGGKKFANHVPPSVVMIGWPSRSLTGDVWSMNVFREVGSAPARQWTMTSNGMS